MGQTLVYKILGEHLAVGQLAPGEPIGIRIDQTLTQDATGTTAYSRSRARSARATRARATASATRFTWNGSPGRAGRSWAATATPPPPAAWG